MINNISLHHRFRLFIHKLCLVVAISALAFLLQGDQVQAQGLVCEEREITVGYLEALPTVTSRAQCELDGVPVGQLSNCTAACSSNASGTAVCSCPSGCLKGGLIVGGQTCGGQAPLATSCGPLTCANTEYCANRGTMNVDCVAKGFAGASCKNAQNQSDNSMCASGVCQGGVCVGSMTTNCGANQCNPLTQFCSNGSCWEKQNAGDFCFGPNGQPDNGQCKSGQCNSSGKCVPEGCSSSEAGDDKCSMGSKMYCYNGSWIKLGACDGALGACNASNNSETKCDGADLVKCAAGSWDKIGNCPLIPSGELCQEHGKTRCVANQLQTCNAGEWTTDSNSICGSTTAGSCSSPGSCVSGKRCEYDPVSGGGYVGTHDCTVGNCNFRENSCSSSEWCEVKNNVGTCRNRLSVGTACGTDNTKCASGTCVEGKCVGTSTNISCTDDPDCPSGFLCGSNGRCSQATGTNPDDNGGNGGLTPSPSPADSCTAGALSRCGSNGQCCANGGVCQGVNGQEVCQIPIISPAQQCAAGGGTCTGWLGFKCSSLTSSGECLSNPQYSSDRSSASSYAGSCGQVDQVCVGGTKAGSLCGDFTVYNQCGGNPPSTPPPGGSPNPSPSPTNYFCNSTCATDAQCQTSDSRFRCALVEDGSKRCRLNTNTVSTTCQPPTGPMCLSISIARADGANQTENNWSPGTAVRFTCGAVQGASSYVFRVVEPDETIVTLQATGAVSAPYTLGKTGRFTAQCQICTIADNQTSCLPFEDPHNEVTE